MSSGGRKSLVWDIRKSLLTLTAEELLRVARAVNPVLDVDQSELVEKDQEECYDHINSFMYSKQLLEAEDEGMVQLFMLKDAIDDIVKCRDVMSFQNAKGDSELHTGQGGDKFDNLVDFAEGSVTIQTPPEHTTDTHPQSRHTSTLVTTTSPSGIVEPDLGLAKVTMLNVPDTSNADLLRIIRPGIFKEMLINKDDMAVIELKGFLQTHLREKNSTELFQELMCTKQDENETPQQFLYRLIGLKQRILLTSKLADTNIKYSPATVQDVFLHTVYQGFGHKHNDIRRELKPLLTTSGVTDEMILRHVMKITSEENERMKRLGGRRQMVTNAHSAQLESDVVKTPSIKAESLGPKSKQTKPDPLSDLTAKVEELTRLVQTMQNQQQLTHNGRQYSQNRTHSKRGRPYGCPSCVEQDRQDCKHCFTCGEEGHRAAGCLQRPKRQGNSNRALERDI
ncbi:uncharacterized protein LOC124377300 [Silurus meridionalis]|uniref:uncharacterized protein LOC124377300 n=1 Tax=Silurus meridionalis TaxID=175797 RepID=UPI001EEAEE4F|nr:uncharacterized protein LOC124377300 [Silurus meridionalis]XP_046692675.1 uncharacterized protein LOC124377300 [Silurus meridionalis]